MLYHSQSNQIEQLPEALNQLAKEKQKILDEENKYKAVQDQRISTLDKNFQLMPVKSEDDGVMRDFKAMYAVVYCNEKYEKLRTIE